MPISPKPHFFGQAEYLWRSFAAAGGHAASARFLVSVGADREPYDVAQERPWSRGDVTWHWVDRDVALFSDAYTMLIRGIDPSRTFLTRPTTN